MKICIKCAENKQLNEFNVRDKVNNILRGVCVLCMKKYKKSYYMSNHSEIKKSRDLKKDEKIIYRKLNLEKSKLYYRCNQNIIKDRSRLYKKENKGNVNASKAKRRAIKIQATPTWLTKFDIDYMKHIYVQAKELEKFDGIKYHVDHVLPLQGKNVRGLHVPWNLQILTAEDNLQKCNTLLTNGEL